MSVSNDQWKAIARRLYNSLIQLEDNPTRLKTWHEAFDAVKAFEYLDSEDSRSRG